MAAKKAAKILVPMGLFLFAGRIPSRSSGKNGSTFIDNLL